MQENKGEKMPLYEGNDGKLYFNFAQGLEMHMHGNDCDKNADYTYKIVGCRYIGTTEYYDVEIDGVPQPQANSANRVKYLLSRYGVKMLASGDRRELPLTVEEVKSYFEYKECERLRLQSEASKLTEYVALKTAAKALSPKIGYLQAFGRDEEAATLEEQRNELDRRADEELTAHGICPDDVAEPARCPKCDGKGYIYTHICACAIPLTHEIKAFNVNNRLRLSKLLRG